MVWCGCDASRALASQSVELSWDASTSTNIVAYKLYYGTESGNYDNYIIFGDISDAVVPDLTESTTYYFAVAALDVAGDESPLSDEVSYTVPPVGFLYLEVQTDAADSQAVDVSWNSSPDGTVYGYQISYGTNSGVYSNSASFYYTTIGTIYGLTPGTTYYFVASPISTTGVEAVASSEIPYTVPTPTPIVLTAQASSNSPSVMLSWNEVPNTATVGYNIYYGTQSGNYSQIAGAGDVTNKTINDLQSGQTYYFAIAALDPFGNQSPLSAEVSATVEGLPPIVLITTTTTDSSGNTYIEIHTDSAVYGNWELDSSTNMVDWTVYANGYGNGLGSGYDIDVNIYVDPTVPHMFFRARQ